MRLIDNYHVYKIIDSQLYSESFSIDRDEYMPLLQEFYNIEVGLRGNLNYIKN